MVEIVSGQTNPPTTTTTITRTRTRGKMPSKLKKAIAAVKDQTSISLAKVGGAESSSLEVAILKATTHDEVPMNERYVIEVLQHMSSNKSYAGSCARAIGRRIGRTRNWVVAVKSLMLILRIFQDGDPYFPKEVLHAMKRGYKILNLSAFRDDSSTSCPWDFTAFVRTLALYLDERLDCFLTGKLQRRMSYHHSGPNRGYSGRKHEPIVRDMKPGMLLDRISHWQRLLDRAVATRPTGAAKTNRLVQTCLYAIVQETFDLYRDISDGLALLLDSFFHLQYNNCVNAFQTCVRASKQFEELCSFYDLCKSIGVGRTSEYPSVQKISDELMETLQEFLKDQSSFPGANGRSSSTRLPLPAPLSPRDDSSSARQSDVDRSRSVSEFGGSQCTSLEDLISADSGFSPERYSDPGGEQPSSQMEEFGNGNDASSVRSDPTDHRGVNSVFDLLCLDDPSPPPELQDQGQQQQDQSLHEAVNNEDEESSSSKQGWELVLFETASTQQQQQQPSPPTQHTSGFEADFFSSISANANTASTSSASWLPPEHSYNPFLQDSNTGDNDPFGSFAQPGVTPTSNAGFSSSGGFPTDLGVGITNTAPPTFEAEFSNSNSNSNSITTMDNFSLSGFPADLGIGSTSTSVPPPTFQANFTDAFGPDITNSTTNKSADLSDLFGHNDRALSHGGSSKVLAAFSDDFSLASTPTTGAPPSFIANARANVSPSTVLQHSDFGSQSFSAAMPSFSADFGDGSANAMNAIVPFGQTSNEDLFSPAPTFSATPTFRATSVDFDHIENDPFGSSRQGDQQSMSGTVDQQRLLQQQQLWLQNQNKIIARHLT